jgi:hypothetical protein
VLISRFSVSLDHVHGPATAPSYSGFTIGQICGIMITCPSSPAAAI